MLFRALTVLALAATPGFAQSWDGLRTLNPGDHIVVLDKDGKDHKGEFRAWTADAIRVAGGKTEESIERSRVRRVQLRTATRRVRNVLIGAGIGTAVAVTVDATLGTYLRNEAGQNAGERALTYVVPIGLFTAIGAALPSYRTIYRAP
jgi:hypothetical protein